MCTIKSIRFRKILNSHALFTNEFIVELEDGSIGVAGSPQGETISIYEDQKNSADPNAIIAKIKSDGYLGMPLEQETLDAYLQQHFPLFGRNNAYGLSLAFFKATAATRSIYDLFNKSRGQLPAPRICCNILNGGRHAYTNPVLSDFPEYLLVSRSNDITDVITDHNEIQCIVKEKLLKQEKTNIAGHLVNRFSTVDNRECIEFVLKILNDLGLSNKFDLMIDASAGDLWTGTGYSLSVTDNSVSSSEEFLEYWMDLIRQYDIVFLEDPFSEKDEGAWQKLTTSQSACKVIGDNFYSSSSDRIAQGAAKHCTHGVIIKPNQSGTVTAVCRAVESAQDAGQVIITSHRSISTEETFISTLSCMYRVPYIKIGPLVTDYSSVMRLNEIIRLTE